MIRLELFVTDHWLYVTSCKFFEVEIALFGMN